MLAVTAPKMVQSGGLVRFSMTRPSILTGIWLIMGAMLASDSFIVV